MKMNQNITQKISTSMAVTPAVQQALKLLQMTNLELSEYLQEQAAENPFLMVESPPIGAESFSDSSERNHFDDNDGTLLEKTLMQPDSIYEQIISQINTHFTNTAEHRLALILFGLLDERGFLTLDMVALAKHLNAPTSMLQGVLSKLKTLEPAGIFAADWKESVLLQLWDQGKETQTYKIILDNFNAVLCGNIEKIQKLTALSKEELYAALKHIKNINPYPLQANSEGTIQTRIPDVFVEKDANNAWIISLNSETLPKVLADREYFKEVKTLCAIPNEQAFIRDAFQKATWLVKAMDQRKQNILKICQSLVQRQQGFLEHGLTLLSPMTLKDVARDTGVHESTVSRAISHKYIQTPQGTFLIKFFFTQSLG